MSYHRIRHTNRRVIHSILRKGLKQQVIAKANIKQANKLSYMIAAKVYSLRSRNAQLTSRVEYR